MDSCEPSQAVPSGQPQEHGFSLVVAVMAGCEVTRADLGDDTLKLSISNPPCSHLETFAAPFLGGYVLAVYQ
jgi:hypothetical protein